MNLLYNQSLLSKLVQSEYLFLDTNILISALQYPTFFELIQKVRRKKIILLSTPSVFFEFLRGGDSLEEFKKRLNFYDNLLTTWPIEKQIVNSEEAIVVLQKVCPHVSYTDFLLGVCLYKLSGSYLLTGDHSAFPLSVFNREETITLDEGVTIRNYGLYSLSMEKFRKAALNILKNK